MILVVDDEKDICELLSIFLKKGGYDVELTYSGKDAIEKFKKLLPKLVFLDIRLPDMDGIEVLRTIKGIKRDIPVIMITAYRDAEKVVQAFRLGAFDCIFKPFDFNYIKTAVMSSIGRGK
jgi:DNA-binding NtrC family response regulator